jgi:hypothetical protein
MMAKIIKFPKQPGTTEKLDPVLKSPQLNKVKPNIGSGTIKIIWVFGVLVWPILKWIV